MLVSQLTRQRVNECFNTQVRPERHGCAMRASGPIRDAAFAGVSHRDACRHDAAAGALPAERRHRTAPHGAPEAQPDWAALLRSELCAQALAPPARVRARRIHRC
eukprot:1271452-Prymnesium_polylepis.1